MFPLLIISRAHIHPIFLFMASTANTTLFAFTFLFTSRAHIRSMFLFMFMECMASTANTPTLSFTPREQTGSVFLFTTFTYPFTIALSITWLSNPTMSRWSSTLPGLLQNGPISST
jgi:hypothetical protein